MADTLTRCEHCGEFNCSDAECGELISECSNCGEPECEGWCDDCGEYRCDPDCTCDDWSDE